MLLTMSKVTASEAYNDVQVLVKLNVQLRNVMPHYSFQTQISSSSVVQRGLAIYFTEHYKSKQFTIS